MIAPMKYVKILCMKEDRDKVLSAVQDSGDMMLCETDGSKPVGGDAPNELRKMEKLLSELKQYDKKSFLDAPDEIESTVLEEENPEATEKVERLAELVGKRDSLSERALKAKSEADGYTPWLSLDVPLEEISDGEYTTVFAATVPSGSFEQCLSAARESGIGLDAVSEGVGKTYAVVTAMKDDDLSALYSCGLERTTLPGGKGTAKANAEALLAESAECTEKAEKLSDEIKSLYADGNAPKLLYDKALNDSERQSAPYTETDDTFCIEGWVPTKKVAQLKKRIERENVVYALSEREPEEGETPPTVLENGKITRQYEGITNMFNPPKYGDFDPNAVMAPWYWVIFGLMMGDAGYGLMMLIIILAAKKIMKPKGGTLALMNVMLYSSIPTIICGILFGSYFGEELLPAVFFTPLKDTMSMLILTLVIGVLHIFTGMGVKIYLNVKEGKLLDAIFDQVSWMLIIAGLGMLFLQPVRTVGMVLAIIGAVIVLLTAGREKKGIFGKITGGLVGLYGVTSYLSDILSYSRILALSLATGVVGMVMNILAGMVSSGIPIPVVRFIPALLIYVVGHVFNLALGLLSAYVHDCRLQYIEFYGKFYEGGGTLFKPFAVKTKYASIKYNDAE